jgi:hypothetical protein
VPQLTTRKSRCTKRWDLLQGSHPGAGDGNSVMALVAGYAGEESEQIKQESSSGTKHASAQLECVQ